MPNYNSISSLDREDCLNVSGVAREQQDTAGLENLSDVHVLARNAIENINVSPLRFDEIRFPGEQQLAGMRAQTQEEIGGMGTGVTRKYCHAPKHSSAIAPAAAKKMSLLADASAVLIGLGSALWPGGPWLACRTDQRRQTDIARESYGEVDACSSTLGSLARAKADETTCVTRCRASTLSQSCRGLDNSRIVAGQRGSTVPSAPRKNMPAVTLRQIARFEDDHESSASAK